MYQFLIYDMDPENGFNNPEDGVIIEVSSLYHNRNSCEESAQQSVNEMEEMMDTEGRFSYVITEIDWAD